MHGVALNFSPIIAAARALRAHGPVPVAFASKDFIYLIDNWAAHLREAGVDGMLIIALDEVVVQRPMPPGCRLGFVAFEGELSDLWRLRLRVFEALAAAGIDFVASDLDAVWLRDPRAACYGMHGCDVVFSQGTFYPPAAHECWGFVLCCGFFAVKGGAVAARFFAAAGEKARDEQDDQVAINLLLLELRTVWEERPGVELAVGSRRIICYRETLAGRCERLGLRVGLLPFHWVPRLALTRGGAMVKHPFSGRDRAERIAVLRQNGIWKEAVH